VRILFITETIPYPLDSGGRIKTWQTLALLSRKHVVHLHAFVRNPVERRHEARLREVCASVHLHLAKRTAIGEVIDLGASLFTGTPLTVGRHWRAGVARRIAESARSAGPDLVYCDHLSALQYGLDLGLPIFHDAHNVEYALVERFAAGHRHTLKAVVAAREWRALERYERAVYPRCQVVSAVSPSDAEAIRRMAGPGVPVVVIPIAYDSSRVDSRAAPPAGPAVLFVGGLHWPPNEEGVRYFAKEIWPLVRAARPDATCRVVGRASATQQRELSGDALTLAGYAQDLAAEWAGARVFVVPLRTGGGMRVKILEAFAHGVPVVSTTVGAEGIDARHGEHLLLADEPAVFAEAVVRLLGDDDRAASLGRAGRHLLEQRYSLEAIEPPLLDAVALAALPPDGGSPPGHSRGSAGLPRATDAGRIGE
jgi:glycosyltransferase involved in cell wall biosynthesis